MGRPRSSWLQQVDRHLKEMGMGQASAWGMARWRPLEYHQWKVDTAAHAPIPDLTCHGSCVQSLSVVLGHQCFCFYSLTHASFILLNHSYRNTLHSVR